jgi:TolB-like protein/DNA-binding winged helix-turn-helix (wHTH) protein
LDRDLEWSLPGGMTLGGAALAPLVQRFEFVGFRLDAQRRTLADPHGQPVAITAKAFDALLYFVEHPGQVIERATLLDAVWPNAVVEENNLSQVVAALRRALGDGVIATVPRRGYQFVADVRIATDEAVAEPRGIPPDRGVLVASPSIRRSDAGGRRVRKLVLTAGLSIGVLALIGTAILAVERRFVREAPRPPALPKVAVLPCENLSPDPDDAYFAAGMHEELLNRLARLRAVRVVARASVMQYAGDRPPIRQIAAELDASAVMECSARRAGDAIVVTAQLIDPVTETHLWAQSYPGHLSDLSALFTMQADIAVNIANALDAKLSRAEQQRLETLPTAAPEAYVEFLKGSQAADFESKLAHLDRAVEIDPAFAEAYVARGMLRVEAVWNGALRSGLAGDVANAPVDFAAQAGRARGDAERALEIDPELGLAHFVLGATLLPLDRAAAEAEFERALALNPAHSVVLSLTAGFYLADLRLEEARALLARIEHPDPGFPPMRTLLLLTRDLDGLAELERRVTASKPTDALARRRLAFAEMVRGNTREAIQHLRVAEQFAGEGGLSPSGPGIYLYGRLGFADEAERMFAALVAEAEAGGFASDTEWVVANLGIGDIARAYEWAARVAARPLPPWIADEHWLVLNPLDDPALEQPEFLALRRKLGYRD